MTGGRCHRRRKMTAGRGAEGGCGAEEGECPDSRVPARIPADSSESLPEAVDFYAQAQKALSLRSPFDAADDADRAAGLPATLPRSLAGFLARHSDSRKRQKKSHSSGDNPKKKKASSRSKAPTIWAETEEYFRDVTMSDIGTLAEVSKFGTNSAATPKCFLIPVLKDENVDTSRNGVEVAVENEGKGSEKENGSVVDEEIGKPEEKMGCEKENGVVVEVEMKKIEEDGQSMEIDSAEDEVLPQSLSVSKSQHGVEWLLGSRNKVSMTVERPTKKRKLLDGDAGLEKVLVPCPCEGHSSLCHFCSAGDTGNESNRLVSCSSCQVSVHRKCYGVQEEDDKNSSWLCSWCKLKTDSSGDAEKPCVLCPKQGGALKPVSRSSKNEGSSNFAHLFCSQWTPGVYVEDLEKMEPIMNVEAVKGTRKKLVCNICKVKWGACIRCSHGTCRSSFHPLCAREARHRMEVWGRYGCDNVELRAFCLKHSEVMDNSSTSKKGDTTVVAGSNSNSINNLPEKSNVGCRNGNHTAAHAEVPDTNSDRSFDSESQDTERGSKLNARSGCNDSQPNNVEGLKKGSEDLNSLDSNFAVVLKKLIDRGKINMEDVASQTGISGDLLSASLSEDTVVPDVQRKIVNWLKKNVHLSALQKNLKIKTRSKASSKIEFGGVDDSDAVSVSVSESDIADRVAVKSVPPRRRTKSSIRILNDPKMLCSSEEIFSDKETAVDEVKVDQHINKEKENSSEASIPHENNLTDPRGVDHETTMSLSEGSGAEPLCSIPPQSDQAEEVLRPMQDGLVNADGNPTFSAADSAVPGLPNMDAKAVISYYIHPEIQKKLVQMQNGVGLNRSPMDFNKGCRDGKVSYAEPSADEMGCKADALHSEQLVKARETGVLELAPEDEVEGEIIYFQNRLLSNAASRKSLTDKLVHCIAKSLPREIDMAHAKRWDAVLVNRYLSELREAKKQGRKERKHKEAQAVLAAATAAAAASSRMSSFRKDGDDTTEQENATTTERSGSISQPIPRAKETLQRVAAPRISSEKHSDFKESGVDFSKEHPRSCDLCRRSETLLNPILVCCGCKVSVHLDCYRSVKESTGPWYCELCEELSSSRGAAAVNFWDQPYFVAECGLCGGSTGAFRKCSNGQWVHAFCAEWVFESKFKRGQINSVEGMETISRATDLCQICQRKCGVCMKCNFGHCLATFHPWCARSAGFFLNVKTSGGKHQHKAYCEKHSVEQRAKAETQKHGVEELKSLKQVRVELERLRLLCERLIKREKLKRELVLCSHDILAVKRDHAARSVLGRSPYPLPDISSESVTTSLKGNTDGYSEAIQRSDDLTVDSTVSVKRRGKASGTTDDQRTEDDCSTSQNQIPRKQKERQQFSGKQIPNRPSSIATRNLMEDGWRSKPKKHETFEKEIMMTSDQASVKNMRLPKGYAYVPADCVSNEKQINQDSGSAEPSEHGG